MSDDTVLLVHTAIVRRANREGLWDVPFRDVDLRMMAKEVADALTDRPEKSPTVVDGHPEFPTPADITKMALEGSD